MNEAATSPTPEPKTNAAAGSINVSIAEIFRDFLLIGATSFGGVVPYLRDSLVTRRKWLDDKEFVELLSISQSLPGLNATNMAVLVGQKLGGALGSLAAILGICLPGGVLMFIVGLIYRAHGDHALATAGLKGVAAASVGLILATVVQLSQRSLEQRVDLVFVALTVIAVNRFHFSVLTALVVLGLAAIFWHRPRVKLEPEAAQ
jgi:chromate transporter